MTTPYSNEIIHKILIDPDPFFLKTGIRIRSETGRIWNTASNWPGEREGLADCPDVRSEDLDLSRRNEMWCLFVFLKIKFWYTVKI